MTMLFMTMLLMTMTMTMTTMTVKMLMTVVNDCGDDSSSGMHGQGEPRSECASGCKCQHRGNTWGCKAGCGEPGVQGSMDD